MGTLMCSYIFDNKLTRLRNAIIKADLEEVKVELKSFKNNNPATNGNNESDQGNTTNSTSITQEDIYLSDLINGQIDTEGNTPLLFSIQMLQFESFKSLLTELKADPNKKNYYTNYAPLHLCATIKKMVLTTQSSSERSKKVSAKSMFTVNTHFSNEKIERCVSMTDGFRTANSSLVTLPYGSVSYVPSVDYNADHMKNRRQFDREMLRDMISLLVENGANTDLEVKVTKQTQMNKLETLEYVTPLFVAIYHSNIVACDELIRLGCDLNYQEKSTKMSPLHLACYLTKKEICNMLLKEPSIQIDLKSNDGNGCMHWSAMSDKDDIGILQLLVRHFKANANEADLIAFINDKNEKLQTPLMFASMQNKTNCVKFLLDNGASIEHQDKSNQSALDYAKQNSCMHLLESYLKLKRSQNNKRTVDSLDFKKTEQKMHTSAVF